MNELERAMQLKVKDCKNCGRVFERERDFLTFSKNWHFCDGGHFWFNCLCGSTMMMKDSFIGWFKLENRLSPEALEVYSNHTDLKKIPHLPNVIMQLQELTESEQYSSTRASKLLRHAPVLANEVLRVANAYKQDSNISINTLEHAVSYLGAVTLSKLALLGFLGSIEPVSKYFSREKFWAESFMVGLISEKLGERISSEYSSDILYLSGAIANIGKLVMAAYSPKDYDKLYEAYTNAPIGTLWVDLEKSLKTSSHEILGEIASIIWGVDKQIAESSYAHHGKPSASETISIREIVSASNQLAHWVNLEPEKMDEKLLYEHVEKLMLSSQDIENFIDMIIPLKVKLEEKLAS